MNTKKGVKILSLILFGLFLVNFFSVGVGAAGTGSNTPGDPSAAGQSAAQGLKVLGQFSLSFINGLFGDTALGNQTLSRLFMAILLGMFIYTAFESFFGDEKYKYVRGIATASATMLAIWGLPDGFLDAIKTGYGAMGATILSVVPFMIIFWFSVKTRSLLMAKATWAFYTVYYFALFLSNYLATFSDTFILPNSTRGDLGANWAYLMAFVVGMFIFFFIFKIRLWIWNEQVVGVGAEIEKGIKVEKIYRQAEREHNKDIAENLRKSARDLEDS